MCHARPGPAQRPSLGGRVSTLLGDITFRLMLQLTLHEPMEEHDANEEILEVEGVE